MAIQTKGRHRFRQKTLVLARVRIVAVQTLSRIRRRMRERGVARRFDIRMARDAKLSGVGKQQSAVGALVRTVAGRTLSVSNRLVNGFCQLDFVGYFAVALGARRRR